MDIDSDSDSLCSKLSTASSRPKLQQELSIPTDSGVSSTMSSAANQQSANGNVQKIDDAKANANANVNGKVNGRVNVPSNENANKPLRIRNRSLVISGSLSPRIVRSRITRVATCTMSRQTARTS